MQGKLKSFLGSERTFLAVLMCLVGMFSFQLGQSSVEVRVGEVEPEQNPAGIIFIDVPETAVPIESFQVVASRSGTKYHRLDCPGANSIKEENKIYFESTELAKAAGYTAASNCEF